MICRQKTSALVSTVFFLVCLCNAHSALAQPSRELGLRAIQTVTGLTQPSSNLTSEHVPVNFGGSKVFSSSEASQRRSVADRRPMAVSVREYGEGTMTKAEITAAAKSIMTPAKANQIAGIIKAAMAQGKVGSGVFIFEQQVRPKGVARDMRLSWSVTVTESGSIFAGDPKVIDPDPTVVYMLYTSQAVETGLPTSWTHPDAGVIKWQLRKRDGTAATPWTVLKTSGAFDESGTDSEFKVNCLANMSTPGCPTGFVDAKTLMAETASASSIIDYVRKVSPAYDEVLDSSTGETIYLPQMTVSYDRREYDRTGCNSGNFRNIGRKGYTLKTTLDRYQVQESDPRPIRINRFEGTSISPTENFDVSQTISLTSQSLSNKVINTFTGALVDSSTIHGLQYLAPITSLSTLTNANNLRLESTQSDMAMSWVPGGNGNYSLYLGTVADNYWGGYAAVYDKSMTFNISNPAFFTKFTLAGAWFDDWLHVMINEKTVYVGPFGGDRLKVVKVPSVWCGWDCGETYETMIQYGESSFGWPELSRNWGVGLSVDLRPYLRSGQNIIAMRTIVAGNGEGAIRIDATSCLAD